MRNKVEGPAQTEKVKLALPSLLCFPCSVNILLKARYSAKEHSVGTQQKQEWVPRALRAYTGHDAVSEKVTARERKGRSRSVGAGGKEKVKKL